MNSMIKIVVPKVIVDERKGGSGKDAWTIREQQALLDVPGKLAPLQFSVRLSDGQNPFEPGEYEVDGSSYTAGKYGRIEFSPKPGARIEAAKVESLKPVKAA